MPLRNRSFRRLLAAQAISQLGDWLYNVALLALVFERTHSAAWLGATTAARVLPIVLLGPVAGVLGDRFDRRVIMIASDVVRVAAMLGFVVMIESGLPIWCAPALAALSTAAASPYPSCVAATMPRLLRSDELVAANSLRAAVGPLAIVTGPMLGAAVLAVAGSAWAFGINAATFAISAALTAAIPDGAAFRPTRTGEREAGLWTELAVGARELLRQRVAARLVGADVLCSLCYGLETVALVAVSVRLGWGESGYGVLIAAVGAGGLLGTVLVGRAARRFGRRAVLSVALGGVAVSLPLLALVPSFAVVVVVAMVNGAGSMIVEVGTETVLQEQLPDEVFARAYGFAFPVSIGGIALGSVIAGPLSGLLGLGGALTVVAVVIAGYALWLGGRAAAPSPVTVAAVRV